MAVGFMSICKDVNVDLLNRCFELGPFHGLRVPHPNDVTQPMLYEPDIAADDDEEEEEEEEEDDEEEAEEEFVDGNVMILNTSDDRLINGEP